LPRTLRASITSYHRRTRSASPWHGSKQSRGCLPTLSPISRLKRW
jgi:hypothetical protein